MAFSLQFLGAAGTVTGSKYLLKHQQKNFLVDCGLFQGLKKLRLQNREPLPLPLRELSAVLLTHAHLDHSGYLPLLAKESYAGPIYATAATQALCGLLLPDSAYLQEEDAAFANRHGFSKHHPALPLYTAKDAQAALRLFNAVPWQKKCPITPGVEAQFFEAGHILGAAMIRLGINGSSIVFSGDLGRSNDSLLREPHAVERTDYLVVESTYGNRLHDARPAADLLLPVLKRTLARGGIVLIPAFAVGRVQSVLYWIQELKARKLLDDVPVYVNSPMGSQASRIYLEYHQDQMLSRQEFAALLRTAHFTETVDASKQLCQLNSPAIIISASGMATGGRVLHHLKTLAPDAKNTILFTGYQAPGTRGQAMLAGAKEIKIHGEMVPVMAEVLGLDALSAHADQGELMQWLRSFKSPPKRTFLIHGEDDARKALSELIQKELGWKVCLPNHLEEVLLG